MSGDRAGKGKGRGRVLNLLERSSELRHVLACGFRVTLLYAVRVRATQAVVAGGEWRKRRVSVFVVYGEFR